MSDIGTGGPAFPWCGDLNDCPTINLGMNLRDYFAAKWLQGWIANPAITDSPPAYVAAYAYEMADAMLKARKS